MEREPVRASASLARGDVVQAYAAGVLHFTGCVTEVHADGGLFWAVDSIGQRQLIDLGSYRVYRLSPPFL